MGLDMYAYSCPAELLVGLSDTDNVWPAISDPDPEFKDSRTAKPEVNTDFVYWRKFNALHGWMSDLYFAKGGTEVFNCEYVRLREADLDKLAADAQIGLKGRGGFFWGTVGDFTEDDREEVLEFVVRARQQLAEGRAVIYSSWW